MARIMNKAGHHFGRRKQEGEHLSPEFTANGPAVHGRDPSWPASDKFLDYMRRHNKPRFENITKDEARGVILRLVK